MYRIKEYTIKYPRIISCVVEPNNVKEVVEILNATRNDAVADIIYKQKDIEDEDTIITIVAANRVLDTHQSILCDGETAIVCIVNAKPNEFPYAFIPAAYLSTFEKFYNSRPYERKGDKNNEK